MPKPSLIHFSVEGEPVAKERARVVQGRRGTRSFTPNKTAVSERVVAWAYKAIHPVGLLQGHVGISMEFYLGTHRRKDLDNLAKLVMDALNGVAWVDDSQVIDMRARLYRGVVNPRTEVDLWEVNVHG